jgi:hypothetical protein
MVRISSKRGAVELSLNLIIMLIIGMVVLGLVIGFVNSLVSKGTDSFDRQLGDNEKLKLEEVSRCSENLCIIPEPSIMLKKGETQNVFLKVRAFISDIDCGAGELNDKSCDVSYEILDDEGTDVTGDSYISLVGPGFSAPDGSDDSKMYSLKADKTTPVGTYYLTLKLYTADDEVSKTITVNVN